MSFKNKILTQLTPQIKTSVTWNDSNCRDTLKMNFDFKTKYPCPGNIVPVHPMCFLCACSFFTTCPNVC